MPDYFVPLDTTHYTHFHRELAAKGVIIQQTLRYVDSHRKQLKKHYPDFQEFKQQFQVPQELLDAVFQEGAQQKVTPRNDEEREKTLPVLSLQLKALIARDLWDMSEYYSIMNEDSKIVAKALELLTATP
jgi:carboxyl-terminal processing protease